MSCSMFAIHDPSVALAPLPSAISPWQRRPTTQLLAAVGIVAPMAAITWWVASTGERVSLSALFLGPLLGGSTMLAWILFLHLAVCGDSMEALGFRRRGLVLDGVLGTALAVAALAFHMAFRAMVQPLFPPRPPTPQIVELLRGVAHDPWLLALWLGPVVWIGVALFEELARCVLLRRLWLVAPGAACRWGAILLVSILIGLGHIYQGPAAMLSITLKSLAFGWLYLYTGRIRTLIVGHGLYDSIQIVQAVIAIRQMGP